MALQVEIARIDHRVTGVSCEQIAVAHHHVLEQTTRQRIEQHDAAEDVRHQVGKEIGRSLSEAASIVLGARGFGGSSGDGSSRPKSQPEDGFAANSRIGAIR